MKGLIFTYAMTYGGAVVALFNPFVGLLIYICFAIIKPESLWHWSVPPGNYSRILAIAFLIGWALKGFGKWEFGRAKPIVMALLGYWGWMILSASMAPDQAAAWGFVESQSKILLPVLVGMTVVESIEQLKKIAWVIMLSQAYVALDLNLSYYSGFNRVAIAGFGGMDNNCISIAMVTGAGLAFFLGLDEDVWWRKWGCFAAAGLMAHVPMFAMSRGGMLGLCVVGVVAFYLIPKQPKHYVVFGLAVIIALRLAGTQVVERFAMTFASAEERDASAQSRVDMWWSCCDVMKNHPLFGAGPDHWPLIADEYGWPKGKQAHSLWFQTGAELGIPGVGLLMASYGLTMLALWQFLKEPSVAESYYTRTARMVIAALVGFVVSVSFVSLSGLEIPYYVVLLGAGTLKVAGQWEPMHETSEAPDRAGVEIADVRC